MRSVWNPTTKSSIGRALGLALEVFMPLRAAVSVCSVRQCAFWGWVV
jgi:hypothetical protein